MFDHMQLAYQVGPQGSILLVGGGAAMIVGGLIVVIYAVYSRHLGARSRDWPSTQGTVIRSEVVPYRTRLTTHEVRIVYRYTVGGRSYISGNVRLFQLGLQSETAAQEVVDRYPVGKWVTVYYDPKHPELAVLEPGAGVIGLYPYAAFIAVGTFVILFGLYLLLFAT